MSPSVRFGLVAAALAGSRGSRPGMTAGIAARPSSRAAECSAMRCTGTHSMKQCLSKRDWTRHMRRGLAAALGSRGSRPWVTAGLQPVPAPALQSAWPAETLADTRGRAVSVTAHGQRAPQCRLTACLALDAGSKKGWGAKLRITSGKIRPKQQTLDSPAGWQGLWACHRQLQSWGLCRAAQQPQRAASGPAARSAGRWATPQSAKHQCK